MILKTTSILIGFLFLLHIPQRLWAQTECSNNTYIKRLGSASSVERGLSLAYSASEKVIYIAGFKDDSLSILRLNENDQIDWVRTFDIIPNRPEHAHKIIVDSDGMIVLSGTAGPYNSLGIVFALRYDPVNDNILWARHYLSYTNAFNHGLEELVPGDDFIMSNNPSVPGNNDSQLLRLNRLTGEVIPSLSFHHDLGDSDALNDIVLHEGFMYANGRYTDGPDFSDMRNTVIKIDPQTGNPIWTLLSHVQTNFNARLYGSGMVLDQGEIYNISVGDENGTSIDVTDIWIQKTSLDGQAQWLKKYDLPGTGDWVDEIISSDGGFVILARERTPRSKIIVFKIDRDGNLIWSNRFDFSSLNNANVIPGMQSSMQHVGDHIYFTAFVEQSGNTDMVLVKMNPDGSLSDSCALVSPVEIAVSNVNNPVFYNVDPELFDFQPEEVVDLAQSNPGAPLLSQELCGANDIIVSSIEAIICQGSQYEGYTKTGIYTDTFSLSSGCDSLRTLYLDVTSCAQLIRYDLNACTSFMSNGTNMDYTEFTPEYLDQPTCADVTATIAFRTPPQMNKHSCTPGLNGTEAMCISAMEGCTYDAGDQASLIIEMSIDPDADSVFSWTGLTFYEKAPVNYNWISGPSGLNNYPTLFGIRILKDGTEIFRESDIPTSLTWSLQSFDFLNNDLFVVSEPTVFRIELLPYCPVGNGEEVAAWDLEDIIISGGCLVPGEKKPVITGLVRTTAELPLVQTQMVLSTTPSFANAQTTETSTEGRFVFDNLQMGGNYFVKGYNNANPGNGVSTIDLIAIQKHLLGIKPFTTIDHLIAADVDHNEKINVLDIVILRKLLLGMIDEFPGNTSWRFGITAQETDLADMLIFQEQFDIESIARDTTNLYVLAVKTGDLTGDAKADLLSAGLETRSQETFNLSFESKTVTAGVPVMIEIRAGDQHLLEGFQLELNTGQMKVLGIQGQHITLTEDHFVISDNRSIRISWHTNEPQAINRNDVLFSITLLPNFTGVINDQIQLTNASFASEIYSPDYQTPVQINLNAVDEAPLQVGTKNIIIAPNPFNTNTKISFQLEESDVISMRFYNATGTLLLAKDQFYNKGFHSVEITDKHLGESKGIVYGHIYGQGFSTVQKLVLLD